MIKSRHFFTFSKTALLTILIILTQSSYSTGTITCYIAPLSSKSNTYPNSFLYNQHGDQVLLTYEKPNLKCSKLYNLPSGKSDNTEDILSYLDNSEKPLLSVLGLSQEYILCIDPYNQKLYHCYFPQQQNSHNTLCNTIPYSFEGKIKAIIAPNSIDSNSNLLLINDQDKPFRLSATNRMTTPQALTYYDQLGNTVRSLEKLNQVIKISNDAQSLLGLDSNGNPSLLQQTLQFIPGRVSTLSDNGEWYATVEQEDINSIHIRNLIQPQIPSLKIAENINGIVTSIYLDPKTNYPLLLGGYCQTVFNTLEPFIWTKKLGVYPLLEIIKLIDPQQSIYNSKSNWMIQTINSISITPNQQLTIVGSAKHRQLNEKTFFILHFCKQATEDLFKLDLKDLCQPIINQAPAELFNMQNSSTNDNNNHFDEITDDVFNCIENDKGLY